LAKLKDDLARDKPNYPGQVIKLTLDIPPSINHCYMNLRGGGKRLTKDAEKWVQKARASTLAQLEDQGFKKDKKDVWWVIEMVYYFPDLRIRDASNCIKVLLDTIENTFFHNDYFALPQIKGCYLDRENPRLEIKAYPMKEVK
jgi:hypothetical protein